MSRFVPLFLVLSLALSAPFPAMAVLDTLKNELVYRTNLGRSDDVKLLLQQGASANETSPEGVPLLSLATVRKDSETLKIMQVLLDAGADINGKDKNGQTALFYAAKEGNMDTAKFLLEHGIDYYSADNKGDIARTIAYQSGHKDVFELLDNFVKDQQKKVNAQYEELNKKIEERYQEMQKPQAAPTVVVEEPAPAPEIATVPAPAPDPKAAQAEADAQAAVAKKRNDEIKELAQQLSFNNCAFQYWSYCKAVKQSSELEVKEINDAIDSYKNAIESLNDRLLNEYHVGKKYAGRITESAKQRMFNQLDGMYSNAYRREQGIGKKDDMQTRCEEIAKDWGTPPPGIAKKKKTGGGTLGNVIQYNGSSTPKSQAPAPQPRQPQKPHSKSAFPPGFKPSSPR